MDARSEIYDRVDATQALTPVLVGRKLPEAKELYVRRKLHWRLANGRNNRSPGTTEQAFDNCATDESRRAGYQGTHGLQCKPGAGALRHTRRFTKST